MAPPPAIKVLVVNPNTSEHMTDALRPVIQSLGYENVTFTYFTSPISGIPSINSPDDAAKSAEICLPVLLEKHTDHDLYLIACYSQHPLVSQLQTELVKQPPSNSSIRPRVTGIFEASITASLTLTSSLPNVGFGIVSTGKIWETALQHAVDEFLGIENSCRFLGCETTGLNANELHRLPAEQVNAKMKEATKRLLKTGQDANTVVGAICLGCAGMVGLELAVREACVEELGADAGNKVAIVDGVKAGVGQLISLSRSGL